MYTLSAVCIIFTYSCNTYKSKTKPYELIKVGNGGGFAGIEFATIIYSDGKISSKDISYNKLKKEIVSQLKSNISVLGLDQLDYNVPGNVYHFLEFSTNGKSRRMTWDPQSKDVPAQLILFYNNINQILYNSKK